VQAPKPTSPLTRRLTKIALWILGILAAIAILGFLVAPPIVKSKAEEILTRELGRPTTIEKVSINPFAPSATIRGFSVKEKDGTTTALSFEELYVRASYTSIIRFAPVISGVRLTRPYAHLVRYPDKKYNFQDLVDRALAPKPETDEPPPRFSVFNIELLDGRVDFDDQAIKEKHEVTQIKLGLPFVSSLPYAQEIDVQPELTALVNGAPVGAKGETKPFKETNETRLDINIDALNVAKFVDYSPVPLKFEMTSGLLDTRLQVLLVTTNNRPSGLSVGGAASLAKVAFQDLKGAPLVAWEKLAIDLDRIDVFGRSARIGSVRLDQPSASVARTRDGNLNLLAFVPELPAQQRATQKSSEPPFRYTVGEIAVTGGKVRAIDEAAGSRPFATELQDVAANVKGLSNEPGRKAEVVASFNTDGLGTLNHTGTLQMEPLEAEGKVTSTGVRVGRIYPYIESLLNLEIADGTLDLDGGYKVAKNGDKLDIQVAGANATLKSLVLHYPGDKEPVAKVPVAEMRDISVDVGKKLVTIGETTSRDGVINARRDPDGTINLTRLIRQVETKDVKSAKVASPAEGAAPEPPWRIDVRRIAAENYAVTFTDRVPDPAVVTRLTKINVVTEGFSNFPGTRSMVRASAVLNGKGTIAANGPLVLNPFSTEMNIETKGLDFAFVQRYIEDRVNIIVTSGNLSTKGLLKASMPPDKPIAVAFRGSATVANFASIDRPTKQDFLNWKSLYVGGVDFVLEPLKVNVNEFALADFFARVILSAEGRLNLQDVMRAPGEAARSVTDVEERRKRAPAAPASQAPPANPLDGAGGEMAAVTADAAASAASRSAPAGSGSKRAGARQSSAIDETRRELAAKMPENIRLGKITVQGGNVRFSDFFIRPNYNANLTGVGGAVSEMTPATPGDVELHGKIDNAAPVDIAGRVNALSPELFVDLKAEARDIELPPLSPYSIKYAGYGIERGKMSVKLKYLIENRKLAAENNLYLDQLTFGEKVESPTATKLPVLLAVALLKDRNGVIDIDLPISGSIDDPQFSVWGIIGRVILNLLTKAVTAPFTLLASLAGSKEELSYVEFDAGRATLDQADEGKLKGLSKALDDRPQLKLDVAGRVEPEADREALRKLSTEQKVKQQKWADLRRQGMAPPTPDEVTVEKAEYEKYLRLAYRAEDFPKPRNVIGFVKDLPPDEMENLMYTNAKVTDEDLRVLANKRAQAAKDWIVEKGKVPAERVFLVAPKLSTEGITDKGKPMRVEFAIK
jgi:uncharacterized protein involved in outer membrane biogenesis